MIGNELLDDPRADPVAVGKELHDIARLNALFGGTRAVVRELEPFFERSGWETGTGKREMWTLLDIGTVLGDIPRAAVAAARRHGVELTPMGMDLSRTAARLARAGGLAATRSSSDHAGTHAVNALAGSNCGQSSAEVRIAEFRPAEVPPADDCRR